jgi:lipid-A-disaccharide synthase
MPQKIMFSVGEISGDFQGANLAREILKIRPELFLCGIGGSRMAEAGVRILADFTYRGVVGLVEVLKHFPAYGLLFFKVKRILKKAPPNLLVLIDNQGFNMILARAAQKLGIPTVYYIAPQEWLWGKTKNLLGVARTITKILAIFPDEAEIYQKAGARVVYIGNPIVDLIPANLEVKSQNQVALELGLASGRRYLTILAGSREQEINHVAPLLFKAAAILSKKLKDIEFLVPVVDERFLEKINREINNLRLPARIFLGKSHEAIKISVLALATSGTVTLEVALLLKPMVIVYKLSRITEWVARKILKINLPSIGLPNLICGARLVPELTQKEATPVKIAQEVLGILDDPGRYQKIVEGLKTVKERVGERGAVSRAAQEIIAMLK